MSRFAVRRADPADAADIAALLARAFEDREVFLFSGSSPGMGDVAALLQTGNEMIVALDGPTVVAVARLWSEDGVEWFDQLASQVPGAGRELVRAAERRAQDAGLRHARTRIPADERLRWVFQRWGYLPVSREGSGDVAALVVERRLPLLTVREQRRADAANIAALTGEDPWIFEQGVRPGWFVLADGERAAGAIVVREGSRGVAKVSPPALMDEYRGRGIELWMIAVAVRYAETRGFHTATLPSVPETDRLARDLEGQRWHLEGRPGAGEYVLRLEGAPLLD